ncbi:MAG: transcriptional regulator [Alteromonadaceae bacterium]|nr:MAG: transcriptional regulator [Alteromonadaceae bacterium]
MNTKLKNPADPLAQWLSGISDPDEMRQALTVMLTEKELGEVEKRLQIYQLLMQKKPQREVASALGVGIATVSRGARALRSEKFEVLEKYLDPTNAQD